MITTRVPKRKWLKVTSASKKDKRGFKPSKAFLRNIQRLAKNKRLPTEEEILEDYEIENPTEYSSHAEERVRPVSYDYTHEKVVQIAEIKNELPLEESIPLFRVQKSPVNSGFIPALHELNGRFLNLKEQVKNGADEQEKLQQEKSLLAREIRRLRKNLHTTPSAQLIAKLKHAPKLTDSKFQKPHQIDPGQVQSYKSSLQELSDLKNLKQQSLIHINKLNLQLEKLQAERTMMEKNLQGEQDMFDQNLDQVGKRLKDKSKVLRLKIENEQIRKKKIRVQQNSLKIDVRDLRDNQDKIQEVKQRAYSIETATHEAQERYQGLFRESKELILSLERFVAEQSRINIEKYNDRRK